jgi:hypothetical protein
MALYGELYTNTTNRCTIAAEALSAAHRRMLFEQSSITPAVAAERGYYSAERPGEVPAAFKRYQRRRGLVLPVYSPDGKSTSYHLRPDKPRVREGKPIKYESPGGSGVILDVHPRMRAEVRRGSTDLFIVEGVKKGDALVSRGVPTIALTSVWMAHVPKTKPKELLACWDHVRLKGRRVYIAFDSDWKYKETVHAALAWLTRALEARGADVKVAYLEDGPDGCKTGADDFLSSGHTVAELKALCRRFEAQDVGRIRLNRDARLRALAQDLEHRLWARPWKGAKTARDVYVVISEAAISRGKMHEDGLRAHISRAEIMGRAKISSAVSYTRAIERLEGMGLIYRDNYGRKPRQRGAFVLVCTPRAKVDHYRGEARPSAASRSAETRYDVCGPHPRAPRLRWSSPPWKPSRKMRERYRKGEISQLPEPRPGVVRPGKYRGHIVDALERAGGRMSLSALAAELGIKRPRDLLRRKRSVASKGRDGALWMLVEAGAIWISEAADSVMLTEGWLDALQRERERGQESTVRYSTPAMEGSVTAPDSSLKAHGSVARDAGGNPVLFEQVVQGEDEIQDARQNVRSKAFHAREAKRSGASSEPQVSHGTRAGRENVARSRKARQAYKPPPKKPWPTDAERRIARLIREGISRRWARMAVLAGDHDLRCVCEVCG